MKKQCTFYDKDYPGDRVARLILERLKGCLYWYQYIYDKKKFQILLSNGKVITCRFDHKNMLHLFGFNSQDLVECGICSTPVMNPYLVLSKISRNAKELVKINKDYNYHLIDFNKIQNRIEALLNLTSFDSFNFACLVFDLSIAEYYNYYSSMKSNHFIFNIPQEGNQMIPMLGINGNQSYIETVFNCEKKNQPRKFTNQTIAYPIFMREHQDDILLSEKFINEEERELLIRMVSEVCDEYLCHIDDEYYFTVYPSDIQKLQRKSGN